MTDMSTDTRTVATDGEWVEIEAKARASTVLYWPELIRLCNRLRVAEDEVERLRHRCRELDASLTDMLDEIERLRSNTNIVVERQKCRNDALEEAALVADAAYRAPSYENEIAGTVADAIRALKEQK